MIADIETSLNPEQRKAVLHGEGPLLILAGAGSGKTRTLTHRIAHLLSQGVSPFSILAMTFTNKAAEEMRSRVNLLVPGKGLSVWLSTFHSFCARFLRQEIGALDRSPHFSIYDDKDSEALLKECLKSLHLADSERLKPSLLYAEISRAKDRLMDATSYAVSPTTLQDPFRQQAAEIYALYQKELLKANAVDFGDLLLLSVEVLREKEEILKRYQTRFRHILIDEYQDTNHAQYILARLLASQHRNLVVVGDDDQSIYSWRGADVRNILRFEKDWPGTTVIRLEENYRSTPQILSASWKMVRNNKDRKEKRLWTKLPSGDPVRWCEFCNELEEAASIVRTLAALKIEAASSHKGLHRIAIFYRTHAQSRVLEDALRRARIPYVVIGNVRFYERAEVKDVLSYLRLLAHPEDDLAFRRILNVPARGLGRVTLTEIEARANQDGKSLWNAVESILEEGELSIGRMDSPAKRGAGLLSRLKDFQNLMLQLQKRLIHFSPAKAVIEVLEKTGYIQRLEEEKTTEASARIENVRELVSAAEEFEETSKGATLESFLEQVALVSPTDGLRDEAVPSAEAVVLMTVHLAKGLEFDAVFMSGMEEGLFPHAESSFSEEEMEEERRLCYVGMTRAKKILYLTSVAQRRLYGQTRLCVPSRFIEEAGLLGASESRSVARGDARGRDHAFRKGVRVRHPEFGPGRVIERSGSDEDLKVTVLFDSGHWKKLLVKYARLEKSS